MSTRLLPSQHSAGIATACAAAYFVVLAFAAFICASSFGTYHDRILYEDASDASNVAFLLPRALSIGQYTLAFLFRLSASSLTKASKQAWARA